MPRQVLLLRFEPQASPPSGEPPTFDVKSGPGTVTVLDDGGYGTPSDVSYETHVAMTGESSFVEDGEIVLDGETLRLSTVGAGVLEPSAEEGTLRGAVLWTVEGDGALSGATGLVTSNFEFAPERGTAVEHQVVRLFLP